MNRLSLAEAYVKGSGYEIGPGHNPWPNPNTASIRYVDKYSREQLLPIFPEESRDRIPETDVLADGFRWLPVNLVDFVVNSHVLEHTPDPIHALNTWMLNLNVGGHLVMAVPDKTECFDRDRDITTWDLVYAATLNDRATLAFQMRQFVDWALVRHGTSEATLKDKVYAYVRDDAHIHFCVWDEEAFRDFLTRYCAVHEHAELVAFQKVGGEFFAVLKRARI